MFNLEENLLRRTVDRKKTSVVLLISRLLCVLASCVSVFAAALAPVCEERSKGNTSSQPPVSKFRDQCNPYGLLRKWSLAPETEACLTTDPQIWESSLRSGSFPGLTNECKYSQPLNLPASFLIQGWVIPSRIGVFEVSESRFGSSSTVGKRNCHKN